MVRTWSVATLLFSFGLAACAVSDQGTAEHEAGRTHDPAATAAALAFPASQADGDRYHPIKAATGWYSLNPNQGLRTDYLPRQATVQGLGHDPAWSLSLTAATIGCDAETASTTTPRRMDSDDAVRALPQRRANGWSEARDRVWYLHESATAEASFWSWYVDGPRGLEQGFTVPKSPACATRDGSTRDALVVRIATGNEVSAKVESSGRNVTLRTTAGETVATYGEASAVDDSGRPLEVRLAAEQGAIVLQVDLRDAVFPIEIDPVVSTLEADLAPPTVPDGNDYGGAVALSGDVAVVGHAGAKHPTSNFYWTGAAYVFRRVNGVWIYQATLRPDDANVSVNFGASVALSDSELFVGSPGDGAKGTDAGAVYRFVYEAGAWVKKAKIYASDAAVDRGFGGAIALQGSRMVVGTSPSPGGGTCCAYVFAKSGSTWGQSTKFSFPSSGGQTQPCSVALDGSTAVMGSPGMSVGSHPYAGTTIVYTLTGSTWAKAKQLSPTDPGDSDAFGAAVAISGGLIVVGAPGTSGAAGFSQGAFYAFRGSGSSWLQERKVFDSGGHSSDRFGTSLALDGHTLLVGAETPMRVKAYWPADTLGSERGTISIGTPGFGRAVSLSGDRALIGTGAYVIRMQRQLGDPCTLGTECPSGFCTDGVCCDIACASPGGVDCLACSKAAGAAQDGVCGPVKAGTTCRATSGLCDVAEKCNGTAQACPDDQTAVSGTVCRGAAGECDLPETCTGTSKACPTDKRRLQGFVCRDARGDCDRDDVCDGASAACPDAVTAAGTVCRAPVGGCDEQEACDGVDPHCPPDAPKRVGTPCRTPQAECDRQESCDGIGFDCPVDQMQPAGTSCRIPASGCDLEEVCDGLAASCPADGIAADGARCPGGTCMGGLCYSDSDPGGGSDSGCGCSAVRSRSESLAWLAPALVLLLARRRRRASCDYY